MHAKLAEFMNKESILQFYPLKYRWLTEVKKIQFKDVNLKTAYLIDIMHYFITKSYLFDKNEFNLWSPLLQKKYGSRYKYYILWLIGNGVIGIKSKWFSGKKAITYKLLIDRDKEQITRFHNTDTILLKKWHQQHTLEQHKLDKDTLQLRQNLIEDLFYIDLDYDAAVNELDKEYAIGLIDHKSHTKNLMTIDSIYNKQIYWNFDKYGRMHTNFTILKKSIRNNFLTIDGEKIDEIDIPNSQPFFLAKLLKKHVTINEDHNSEFSSFISAVRNGTFYDSFLDMDSSRKDVKKFVYKIFFDRNYKYDEKNLKFRQIWPQLWLWIKNWKIEHGDYAALAWELQRQESDLIFKQVCTEIKDKNPDIRLFTVHDSIFFQQQNKPRIEPIFNKYLSQVLVED